MQRELLEKIPGTEYPIEVGDYITNMGSLHFDGDAFLMPGHSRRTATTVDWWLQPISNETNFDLTDPE